MGTAAVPLLSPQGFVTVAAAVLPPEPSVPSSEPTARPAHPTPVSVGTAADHAGLSLKEALAQLMSDAPYHVVDFGPTAYDPRDDYPRFVIPLAQAVARGELVRGIAVCGSGVGAYVAANKVRGVRAATIGDTSSARQGVEDDDLNVLCLGARVVGDALAWEIVRAFLAAQFSGLERHRRRLAQIAALEG